MVGHLVAPSFPKSSIIALHVGLQCSEGHPRLPPSPSFSNAAAVFIKFLEPRNAVSQSWGVDPSKGRDSALWEEGPRRGHAVVCKNLSRCTVRVGGEVPLSLNSCDWDLRGEGGMSPQPPSHCWASVLLPSAPGSCEHPANTQQASPVSKRHHKCL